jgi:CBS domain-containing protein
MTTSVVIIQSSATVAKAIETMREHGVHALIVDRQDSNDAYGIMTDSDVVYKVIAYDKDPSAMRVTEIMTKPCVVVNPDLDVEYVARLFANLHIHRAPVIKEGLLGVISITDILHRGAMEPHEDPLHLQIHPSPARLDK